MSALAVEPLVAERPAAHHAGGAETLEELLARAYENGQRGAACTCVVCGGLMEPRPGGAACGRCGSRLH